MKIVPIVLATTIPEFREQLSKVSPLSRQLNIDIADGLAAPNTTLDLATILQELRQWPNYQSLKLDFDLMVKQPEPLINELNHLLDEFDINSAVIHQKYFRKPLAADFQVGLAIDFDDQINQKLVSQVGLIQIMTINLGFQGTPFQKEALIKITQLRQQGFDGQIVIDGGVNPETLTLIMENKGLPDVVGVGGYLTRAADPNFNWQKLQQVLANYVD